YSLADSPVGLLAWIYEKLVAWSDDYPWTDDEGKPAPAMRFHLLPHSNPSTSARMGLHILTGVSFFPGEIVRLPKSCVPLRVPCQSSGEHDQGGHFAAHEVPDRLAYDLRKMSGRGGPAIGVVPGRSGYSKPQCRAHTA
ncbi:hypothetical protein C8T65DRAFT_598070, partial [Cerioporus squamosus]